MLVLLWFTYIIGYFEALVIFVYFLVLYFPMNSFFFQGFLDLRLEPWIRNMLTRCLAIVPSLIVAVIGGSAGAGKLIIIASVRYHFNRIFFHLFYFGLCFY